MSKRTGEFLKKRRSQTDVCDLLPLSFHLKAIFTARTNDRVLSLCLGQAKYRTASGALTVNVRLSVAELGTAKTEKTEKSIVFLAPFDDVARKHSEKDQNNERNRQKIVGEVKKEPCFRCFHRKED